MNSNTNAAAPGTERHTRQRQPNLTSHDPYAVLGLLRGATDREVKRAYFELVRAYPPEEKPDAFKLIRAAYEKLRTAEAKSETDLFLFQPPPPWEPRRRLPKLNLEFQPDVLWLLLQQHGDLGQLDHHSDFRTINV